MNSLKTKKELLAVMGKTRNRFSKSFGKMISFLSRKNKRFNSISLNQELADKNLVYTLASSKIPSSEQIKHLDKTLSKKESLAIKICLAVVLINIAYLGVRFYNQHISITPVSGGTYSEGLIGYPKTINPLYDVNRDVDSDLSALIYSRLFTYDASGQLVSDLADKIETSDNKTFIITLKNNVKWHSGEALTADDVIFTFHLITNPDYRSPLRKNFSSVSIEKISDSQVKFTLTNAYAAFPSLLTFGIMPQSVWENVSADSASLTDLNLQPIGSGPYKFSSLLKSKQGELKEYRLVANDDYYGKKPFIKNITFKFYPDSNELISALNDGNILGIAYLSLDQKSSILAQNSLNFNSLDSAQENLIFLNSTNNKELSDLEVRQALALAVDKNTIVKDIFNNFYKLIDGPLPLSSFAYSNQVDKYDFNPELANSKLDAAGWSKIVINSANLTSTSSEVEAIVAFASSTSEKTDGIWRFKKDKKGNVTLLTIKLSAVQDSDSWLVADKIKKYWEAVGVHTNLDSVTTDEISNLISSRSFEALVFSELLGGDPDIFAFWHSSQVGDKGLNIAGYKNDKVDKLLENARVTTDRGERISNYGEVQKIITSELPAIFLYEKNYIYVQSKKVKGFSGTAIIQPSDRFAGIANWYLKSKNKFSW
ncbi:MAG: peptide ABC transporter substrate-binding protein [Candidatus Falkowbacteria bacterium]